MEGLDKTSCHHHSRVQQCIPGLLEIYIQAGPDIHVNKKKKMHRINLKRLDGWLMRYFFLLSLNLDKVLLIFFLDAPIHTESTSKLHEKF
jgi:hypothetical protein